MLLWTFMNQVFFWTYVSIFLSMYVWVGFLGHVVVLCLTFWRTDTIFQGAVLLYIPSIGVWKFWLHHILTNTLLCLFDYSHPSGCEVISHCGFDFLFLIDSVSVAFVFLEIFPFHLHHLICWNTIAQFSLHSLFHFCKVGSNMSLLSFYLCLSR